MSDSLLIQEITDLRARLAASEAEVEKYRMRIAAISTASFQNTETTRKDRIAAGHEYWTVAYGDVCAAVDREIAHREALAESERKREEAENALVEARAKMNEQYNLILDLRTSGLYSNPPEKKSQEKS